MKRFLLLLSCSAAMLFGAELTAVRSVYLLPMSRGLDQYLANRLTTEHVLQVVTDPKLADAIITDRIGEGFEEQLADLLPSPEPVVPPPPQDAPANQSPAASLAQAPSNKLANPLTSSTFGRARGMVFLVDPKSHTVLWSAYQPPKSAATSDLERSASDIVKGLKRDLKKP